MRGLALALALAAPARAAKTESTPAQTYWDRIMEAQALRDMREGAVALESKRYEEALKHLARAAAQTPTDPMAHKMLGTAYYWTGRVDLAETEFQEALRLGPDAQGHLLLGIVQAWKGENEPALASFLKAAEFDPSRADIQMNIGSIEEGRGRYQDALERFRRAVELDGQHPLYRFQLGMAFKRLGRDEEAASELRQAIKLFAGYQDAILELGSLEERDAVARFRLARLLLASGKKDKAREVLRGVFRLTPADKGGGLALAVAYGGTPPPAPSPAGWPRDAPEPEPGAGGALDVVSRNLARVPLDQEAVLEVNLAFVTKPKLVKKVKDEGGSLRRALEAAGKVPEQPASGGHKEYQLPSGSREERRAAIGRVLDDLKKTLDQAPADAETRVGMNLRFSDRPTAGAGGDPAGKAKVSYQPRDVGN
ncbi:MAG: tetratricopeptide repeat protein, partial [Elusimicrobia bacterium]|nr:tetratricopeptide repeat protein [Elusimicrobiota bacterium]